MEEGEDADERVEVENEDEEGGWWIGGLKRR